MPSPPRTPDASIWYNARHVGAASAMSTPMTESAPSIFFAATERSIGSDKVLNAIRHNSSADPANRYRDQLSSQAV
jgi:hypothetical protein